MKWLNVITLALTILGGLNWGLLAIGGYSMDLVANLFGGPDTAGARGLYALVGLSALWQIVPFLSAVRTNEVDAEGHHHHEPRPTP